MTKSSAHETFVDKWRARWPEWAVAEVFLPAAQREPAAAWFALLQGFAEAAWGGTDPAPGLAKLAWWQEELRGWAKGARRHPLGAILRPSFAAWGALADAMPSLRHRDLPARPEEAMAELQGFGEACAGVESALFDAPSTPPLATITLLAGPAVREGGQAAATPLLQAWPQAAGGARAVRVHGGLVRLRLRQAKVHGRWEPAPRWRSLWNAWRAARN